MKIVFFGTAEFAIPSLRALIGSTHEVVTVVTQPDRARGRNLKLSPPPVKVLAETRGIPVYQPADASCPEAVARLQALAPDLFVVIAFGQILGKEALAIPKKYSVNVHGSMLPRWRGAAPTNWAIMSGDSASGVTVIRMNERMDEGDIIAARETTIDAGETNITLGERLSEMGAGLLLESLELIGRGTERFARQREDQATTAPKLRKEDGLIDWRLDAGAICRRVRGLIPWPGAYTYLGDKALKILAVEACDCPANTAAEAGEVMEVVKGKGVVVKAGSGAVAVTHLQIEGKKALDADAFVRGHRIAEGDRFGPR
jgi:methionyl-tRNA formyltransferase